MFNIDPKLQKINNLIQAIADELSGWSGGQGDIHDGLEALDLQPTSQAAAFAAQAAVSVLLAHDLAYDEKGKREESDDAEKVTCPKCGKRYKAMGLPRHLANCEGTLQATAGDAKS